MSTQTQTHAEPEARIEWENFETRWGLAKRVGFRFVFAYLVLYNLPFPLGEPTFTDAVAQKYDDLWQPLVAWVGEHVLHLGYEISFAPTGSGDTTHRYIQALCFLTLAALATLLWSALDRERPGYERLYKWLRLYVRFVLGYTMMVYGASKIIPLQMPAPSLARLIEPYGDSSPMGLLWTFVGASKEFEILSGCAEMLGGVLLILPRTTLLGALVCLADTAMIFTFNMCYDVPVKLYSLHLLLMSVFLVAPDFRRLLNLFLLNRGAEAPYSPPLFRRARLDRAALVLQVLFGLYLAGLSMYGVYQLSKVAGSYAPKPPLYGIWVVDEFSLDGEARPPLTTDAARWQRVIFQRAKSLTIQPMTGPNQTFTLELNEEAGTLSLGKAEDPNWKAALTFDKPDEGRMAIEGEADGHEIRARLSRFDESTFLLKSRGFHWVQERPFNR
jgi:uncharacterized membrane protein YphA (DoxX/SURF4 family)